MKLTLGSRTSQLALWQSRHVMAALQAAWPGLECAIEPFVTQGDKTLDRPLPEIGGKGLFTLELENGLREGRIDLAVHSLKDLPVDDAPGLTLGAIPGRADVRDVLVAKDGVTLGTLPSGAVVGTSSLRRQAQLLALRPGLTVRSIRGNVETRIHKALHGEYDATLLAGAGVTRLGLDANISQWLALDVMLPAPGQGALGVQCRAEDEATLHFLAAIHNAEVAQAVTAERAFLAGLGGGCSIPVGAYATVSGGTIHLSGLVAAVDGSRIIRVEGSGPSAAELGASLAAEAKSQGAAELIGMERG
ncbi:MAG: hydroxymethylbilane synthase [Caldilineaceae bacterium]|nr:hydroxymethylbilane synthase [Caldilineaceae bacterium]